MMPVLKTVGLLWLLTFFVSPPAWAAQDLPSGVMLAQSDKGTLDRWQRLSPEETEEFHFMRGYSYFQEDDFDKALHEFSEVQNGAGVYAAPSAYYAAHINYERGNYATALPVFQRLESDENFRKVVG